MDIIKKIAREEAKVHIKLAKKLSKRYYRVPGLGIVMHKRSPIHNLVQYFEGADPTINWDWVYYNNITRNYELERDRLASILCIEVKKLVSAKVINAIEASRIKRLVRADKSSMDLAKVLINNYRNIRLKKQKNARKAGLL